MRSSYKVSASRKLVAISHPRDYHELLVALSEVIIRYTSVNNGGSKRDCLDALEEVRYKLEHGGD